MPPRARLGLAAAVGLAAAIVGSWALPSAARERALRATLVTVTAGKPSEYAFTMSKSALPWPAGSSSSSVTFKVTNKGALSHRFAVCSTPSASATANSCKGSATKMLAPGQSATLTVTFRQSGTYEYLSCAPGQAAKGMKGLIRIGTTTATTTPKTTTTAKTTTTPTPSPSPTPSPAPAPSTPLTGAAAAGETVWDTDGCSSCHSLSDVQAASGGNVSPDLNSTHTGGPFPDGPLTATQISEIAAYVGS